MQETSWTSAIFRVQLDWSSDIFMPFFFFFLVILCFNMTKCIHPFYQKKKKKKKIILWTVVKCWQCQNKACSNGLSESKDKHTNFCLFLQINLNSHLRSSQRLYFPEELRESQTVASQLYVDWDMGYDLQVAWNCHQHNICTHFWEA